LDGKYRHPADNAKIKFRQNNGNGSKKKNIIWILLITITSFFTSIILTIGSSNILEEADILTSFLVILVIILVNIIFDIIGTAVTAAEETPFHAMASRKVYGAKQSIKLIRNADKVSNVCNDVVGDICGIISGAAGTYIIFRVIGSEESLTLVELIITGMITAMTVGGKALGKTIALSNSNYIIYRVGVIIKFFSDKTAFMKRKGKKKK